MTRPSGVRDDEGVHAAQGRERLQVTVDGGREGGLGVGVRGVAAEVQALDLAQFAVVVDLAVHDGPEAVGRAERLVSVREVDDGEAHVAQPGGAGEVFADAVGAAVADAGQHLAPDLFARAGWVMDRHDAAHTP